MPRSVSGVARQGVVVPVVPLPEGARVEVVLAEECPAIPPELEEELRAWDRASARALETVERLVEGAA